MKIAAADPNQTLTAATGCNDMGFTNTWCQRNGYDPVGNRWVSSATGLTITDEVPTGAESASPFNNKNQIQNPKYPVGAYDEIGNLLNMGGVRTATYDAENRQVTARPSNNEPTVYAYDGEGRRVRKTTCPVGTVTCIAAVSGAVTTTFVYDAMGQLAAEYGGPPVTDPGTRYLFGDHLGSTRIVIKPDANVDKTYDYLPFGEEIGGLYPASAAVRGRQRLEFTSKERDAETGLDYFGARYYSSAQGRFTSPDVPLIAQRPGDPQSWNLYAYVRNNPLIYIDSTGHVLELAKNAGRGDRKNYNSAVNYVSRDSGASGILSTLRNSSSTYTVEIIHDGNDRFDPRNNTIYWDPKSALAVVDQSGLLTGDTQTPALGLAHELDHAAAKDQGILAPMPDPQYGTTEGKRVITGSETQAAGTLREPTRQDHGGVPYESKKSTSTKPTRTGRKELKQEEKNRGQQPPPYIFYEH